jgi:hypothetical protein
MNKLILRVIRGLSGFWERIGVDPGQLLAITEARLKMDARRTHFLAQYRSSEKNSGLGSRFLLAFFLFIFGAFMGALFFVIDNLGMAMFLYFTAWMVLLAMMLITDFTEVLIDSRDNSILLTRPVNGRTITVARLIQIAVYLFKITLAFAIPALILLPWLTGPIGLPVLVLQLILSMVLVILFVNACYLLIFRLFTPRRIKDILGYFQIAISTVVILGYYVVPRLLDLDSTGSRDLYDPSWLGLFPSTWIAALGDVLLTGELRVEAIYYSALAFLMPLVGGFVVVGLLAPQFNRQLMSMSFSVSSDSAGESAGPKRIKGESRYYQWWQRRFQHPEERASFALTWKITGRDREYKVRSFPIYGLTIAYFFMIFWTGDGSFADRWSDFLQSKLYLVLLYLTFLPGLVFIQNCFFTKRVERAWVFVAAPVREPGRLLIGTLSAALIKYVLPLHLLVSVLILSVFGWTKVPDLIFSLLAILLAILGSAQLMLRYLPFSRSMDEAQQGASVGMFFLSTILAGCMGGIHYVLSLFPWLFVVAIPLVLFGIWRTLRSFRSLSWKMILD